jgi:hypothetical protein
MDNKFIASINKLGGAIEESVNSDGPLVKAILAAAAKKNNINKISVGGSNISGVLYPVEFLAKKIISKILE